MCVSWHVFAADFDYVRVGRQLDFVASLAPLHCVLIKLLDDNLAEAEEWFTVQVSTLWNAGNAPDDQLRLTIQPSDGEWLSEQSVCCKEFQNTRNKASSKPAIVFLTHFTMCCNSLMYVAM